MKYLSSEIYSSNQKKVTLTYLRNMPSFIKSLLVIEKTTMKAFKIKTIRNSHAFLTLQRRTTKDK